MSSNIGKLYHEENQEHAEIPDRAMRARRTGLRRRGKALFYRDSMKIVLMGLASLPFGAALMAQSADSPSSSAEFMKTANLWQILQAGGPAMIPLGILSVITLALVIAFLFSLRPGTMVTRRYMQTADALIRKKDYLGLLAISNRHNEALARVIQRTMDFLTKNPRATLAEIREIAQTEGLRQASALNQRIAYLADIGTIAPMIGLLGTVIGIVRSFGVIAIDAAATRPTMLAQGIGEALIATAAGLLIGIPAMAAYSYFRGRVHALISELEGASTQLLALLSTSVRASPAGIQPESMEVS
jgi:biopolymer transport protein ExbB